MGIFEGCLLACDVDGTLMINGYINPTNIEKIRYFTDEGGIFVISTGRGVTALGTVTDKVDVSIAVVANGCMIYDYKSSQILYNRLLPEKDYNIVNTVADMGFDVGIEVHSGTQAYTLKRNAATDLHQTYEKFEAPDVEYNDIDSLKWHKVIYLFNNADDRDKAKERLKGLQADCIFINTCAVIGDKLQNYLEQVPTGVSKAIALKKLTEILDIKKGKLFAIGDYYNDLEMLELSDICAVPNNSPDDIKKIADYVTCSCEDGAVGDFIAHLEASFI